MMPLVRLVIFYSFLLSAIAIRGYKSATHKSFAQKPHIILFVADDLGWNDVGFHGSNEIPTPNIDALAYHGLILNRHYTQSSCTPSRAALLTGKYPITLGLQGRPIIEGARVAVPQNETLLPQRLKELGYVTRKIGKWHIGYYKTELTPTARGFDSFLGYYNGWVRYNDSVCSGDSMEGIDAWHNLDHSGDRFYKKYNTDVFTDEAIDLINNHDTTQPLFLDLSYTAVHAISRNTLQVRNETENELRFGYIMDPNRRALAGVLTSMDDSIGKVIQSLHEKGMLSNSILLFMSDNGGATKDSRNTFRNWSSNWPLRGHKGSLTEGAVRGAAAIWSPLLRQGEVLTELMHLVDWLPTFYEIADGKLQNLGTINGVSQWKFLSHQNASSSREELLVNLKDGTDEGALIRENWKFIRNKVKSTYSGVSGRSDIPPYNVSAVLSSQVHRILSTYSHHKFNESDFLALRRKAIIDDDCVHRIRANKTELNKELLCFQTGCLFDLENDPCEFTDLSGQNPELLKNLNESLFTYRKILIPLQDDTVDRNADPKYFDGYWTPWVKTEPTTPVKSNVKIFAEDL